MQERSLLTTLKEMGWGTKEFEELLCELREEMPELFKTSEKDIVKLVDELRVPFSLSGRKYLIEALKCGIEIEGRSYLFNDIYPPIGRMFGKSVYQIQGAINQVKEQVILIGSPKMMEIFGNILKSGEDNLKTAEFINGLIAYLKTSKN